jgi:hypothetical protein
MMFLEWKGLGEGRAILEELLDAGNHFDDVDANKIWNIINRHIQAAITGGIPLPRDFMLRNRRQRPQETTAQVLATAIIKKVLREVI